MLPSIRRFGVRSPTQRRRLPAQNHNRRHDETARKFELRGEHHKRGSTSRRNLLHGRWSVDHDQQSLIPSNRRRHERRLRDRDEQEILVVSIAHPRGIFRSAVRQIAEAAVIFRLRRHIPRTTSVRVLRDGHR